MANRLRNEVEIELGGETRIMRATFAAIRGIEAALGMNLLPLIETLSRGDIGVGQAAIIIHQGLKGYGDTRFSLDDVGEAIMSVGLPAIAEPVMKFVGIAMEGVSMGKPKAPEAAA